MAIPNRTVITCPNCGLSEAVIVGDSSVGPGGRISDTPLYSLAGARNWTASGRTPQDTISCKACGHKDFITLGEQVRIRGVHPRPRPQAKTDQTHDT